MKPRWWAVHSCWAGHTWKLVGVNHVTLEYIYLCTDKSGNGHKTIFLYQCSACLTTKTEEREGKWTTEGMVRE